MSRACVQWVRSVDIEDGYIRARADRLRGTQLFMDKVTVTGTENLMMAAVLADGETVIENAAREPEVTDLAEFLNALGAQITGAGSDRIVIRGVERLHGGSYRVQPDRIEAGTFLVAGAITRGSLRVERVCPEHLDAVLAKLQEAGARIATGHDWVELDMRAGVRAQSISALRPTRGSRPTCRRSSRRWNAVAGRRRRHDRERVRESIHACATSSSAWAPISGSRATPRSCRAVPELHAAPVMATDLRASASLVIAGLVAAGETVVDRIYHIDRGYECIEEKLGPARCAHSPRRLDPSDLVASPAGRILPAV